MGPQDDQPIRSVIVDDDRSIGGVLGELISGPHVAVKVFSNAREAVQFIGQHSVDIVITDLMMPDVSGLDVLSFAKESSPDAIVIIITGHGTLETAIEAVRKGAYEYIKKPFKLEEIEIAFSNAVEKIRLVRKNKELFARLQDACDELIAVKQACQQSAEQSRCNAEPERTSRLNFFSSNLPNLEFLRKANEGHKKLFDRLHHISVMKKDGLLNEKEFKALKHHIIKGLEAFSVQ
jgi:FixJ family two-component response regulator